GGFDVQLSYTYTDELSNVIFSVQVYDNGDGRTIFDLSDATCSASTNAFNVADAALTGSSSATAFGTENSTNSSVLSGATFTDANPGNHTGDFTATIHWGDLSTSTGVVSYSGGSYSVAGSHTYSEEGSYSISIDIVDDGGSTATITGTATVADAGL